MRSKSNADFIPMATTTVDSTPKATPEATLEGIANVTPDDLMEEEVNPNGMCQATTTAATRKLTPVSLHRHNKKQIDIKAQNMSGRSLPEQILMMRLQDEANAAVMKAEFEKQHWLQELEKVDHGIRVIEDELTTCVDRYERHELQGALQQKKRQRKRLAKMRTCFRF